MNDEFKKLSQGDVTRYVLENATGMGASSVASMPMPMGGMQRRKGNNLIAQEADKKTEPPKTRNPVAKAHQTVGSGSGAHSNKKKNASVPRKEKHKKPYMETLQARLDQLKSNVAEGTDDNAIWNQYGQYSKEDLMQEFPQITPKDAQTIVNYSQYAWDFVKSGATKQPEFINAKNQVIQRVQQAMRGQQGVAEANSPAQLDEFLPALAAGAGALARGAAAAGGAAIKGAQAAGRVISKVPAAAEKKVIQGAEVLNALVPGGIFNPDGSVKGSQYLTKYLTPQQIQQAQQQGVTEGFNGEYDDEAGMAQSNLLTTARAVMGLLKTIKDRDNLPEWGQEKIAKAEMMLVSVWDYLQSQKAMGNDPQQGMEEDMSRRGFLKGAGAMAAGISAASGAHADNQTDPNKLIAIVNIDGESKEFNLTGRFKGDVKSQLHQAEDFITEFLEKRDINFSNLELRYQGAVLKTQNTGSVKEEQGVAEDFSKELRDKLDREMLRISNPEKYQHQQQINQQDREHELNIGSQGRAELKQKADELAEIKREKLRQERLEDEELANQRYTKRAEREQEMEKISLRYNHELKLINTEHGNNMEAIKTGNSHELTKMDKEYAEADRERRHAAGESDKDRAERAREREAERREREDERQANRQEPIKTPPLPTPANIPSNGLGGQATVKDEPEDEPEDDYYDIPPGANFDPNTGKPLKPQNSQQWHTNQQLQYNKPSKPSKYNNDDAIDVDAKPVPNQPLKLKEKLSVVRDPAHATGIQQTGGITHGSVYIPGKGWQTRQTPVLKHEIAVDAKGRTQKQWFQLVKSNFPDAKIRQSKMIDGPCFAILPNGKKLDWEPVEQRRAEGNNTYFESLNSMLERQLEPTMDLDAWVDNFQNADPNKYHQFKNKTPEKKK